MAIGQAGASFFQNYPASNAYSVNGELWKKLTALNIAPMTTAPFTALGGTRVDMPLPDSGLAAWVKAQFIGTLTVTGDAVTTTDLWPHGLINTAALAVNGQTQLISCSGLDLRAHHNRLYRNPTEQVNSAPGTDAKLNPIGGSSIAVGTYDVVLTFDIPIVHDMASLAGLLYLQTSQNSFGLTLQPEAAANLFGGSGVAALTGNFYPELTFFDIPELQGNGKQPGGPLLPPMKWLHALQTKETPAVGSGPVDIPLGKYPGQLLALYNYMYQGAPGVILDPKSSYDGLQLQYGMNRTPRTWTGPSGQGILTLLAENQQDYNGLIGQYFVLDFEKDDPQRDVIYPVALNGFQLVPTVTAADALTTGSKAHVVSEILYSAS